MILMKYSLKQDYECKDRATLEKLVQNLIALYNITQKWSLRGHSPSQARTHPNALELLDSHQSTLNKRLVKMIKSATIDLMKLFCIYLQIVALIRVLSDGLNSNS